MHACTYLHAHAFNARLDLRIVCGVQVLEAIATLCRNKALATIIVQTGFAPDLLKVAFDGSGGSGIIAGGVRRAAVNSLVSLSINYGARVELRRQVGRKEVRGKR